MAIQNCIIMACSIGGDNDSGSSQGNIKILNEDPDYPTFSSDHSLYHGPELSKSHKWYHYILCGYHGVLVNKLLSIQPNEITEHARKLQDDNHPIDTSQSLKDLMNLTLYVASDLPPASGLSSSSALVCASAIATEILMISSKRDRSNQELQIDSQRLAEACSKFEHLVGTHGGGMDQAVIMTAQDGYAKFVEFLPIFKCENVRLPDNVAWLVSHCGSDYPKAATSTFNLRVLETKIGAALIAKRLDRDNQIRLDQSITLSKIKSALFPGTSSENIIDIIRGEVFHKEHYTIEEVCQELGLSLDQLRGRFDISAIENDPNVEMISPKLRCEHVFEEAERVIKFKSICDTNCDIRMLGELMTQGHYSLRDKYQCSHPALDELVQVALDAGALGARLTGAGWGGCIVVMVEVDKCDKVTEHLGRTSKFTFQTGPCKGSRIIKV